MKLFCVICCYGWQRWTTTENWKKGYLLMPWLQKSSKNKGLDRQTDSSLRKDCMTSASEECTILDRIKWNSKPPFPPPPNQGSLIWGGSGGTNFPSILSQIVVCCHEASLTAETKKAYSKWTQNRKYFRQAIFRDKNKFPYALINLIQISKTKGLCLHFYNFPEFFNGSVPQKV